MDDYRNIYSQIRNLFRFDDLTENIVLNILKENFFVAKKDETGIYGLDSRGHFLFIRLDEDYVCIEECDSNDSDKYYYLDKNMNNWNVMEDKFALIDMIDPAAALERDPNEEYLVITAKGLKWLKARELL